MYEEDKKYYGGAQKIRRLVANLASQAPPEHVILSPGALIAIRLIFERIEVNTLILSSEGYYGPSHFPGTKTHVVSVDKLVQSTSEIQPDAIILSSVTWKGRIMPVESIFSDIRSKLGNSCPLLLCDDMHGGAAGFRDINSYGSDIVFGGIDKWVTPVEWNDQIAFLLPLNNNYAEICIDTFRSFFLATQNQRNDLARWLDPETTMQEARYLEKNQIDRQTLQEQYKENLQLATDISIKLRRRDKPTSAILWISEDEVAQIEKLSEVVPPRLIWRLPGEGARVLCRADALSSSTKASRVDPTAFDGRAEDE